MHPTCAICKISLRDEPPYWTDKEGRPVHMMCARFAHGGATKSVKMSTLFKEHCDTR